VQVFIIIPFLQNGASPNPEAFIAPNHYDFILGDGKVTTVTGRDRSYNTFVIIPLLS
jgi:DNA/RNA endonuclease YhcR with UshA esterase domain